MSFQYMYKEFIKIPKSACTTGLRCNTRLQTDGLHIGSLEITRGLRSSKIRPVMTRLADRAD